MPGSLPRVVHTGKTITLCPEGVHVLEQDDKREQCQCYSYENKQKKKEGHEIRDEESHQDGSRVVAMVIRPFLLHPQWL